MANTSFQLLLKCLLRTLRHFSTYQSGALNVALYVSEKIIIIRHTVWILSKEKSKFSNFWKFAFHRGFYRLFLVTFLVKLFFHIPLKNILHVLRWCSRYLRDALSLVLHTGKTMMFIGYIDPNIFTQTGGGPYMPPPLQVISIRHMVPIWRVIIIFPWI